MKTAENIQTGTLQISDKVFTVGNFLSASRVMVLPLIIWLHLINGMQPNLAMGLAVIYLILSDFLDGYAARKLDQISETGKWLDPLADKLCAATLFTYAWIIGFVPEWLFFIVIVRDVVILIGSVMIKKKRGKVAMSVMTGKIAVNILALYWLALFFTPALTTVILFFKYASLFMLLLSGGVYVVRGYRILKGADFK